MSTLLVLCTVHLSTWRIGKDDPYWEPPLVVSHHLLDLAFTFLEAPNAQTCFASTFDVCDGAATSNANVHFLARVSRHCIAEKRAKKTARAGS